MISVRQVLVWLGRLAPACLASGVAAAPSYQVLQNFVHSTEGQFPLSMLMEGGDGRLYGTTSQGGNHGHGTVFAMAVDGSEFTVLRHLASSSDGANPFAGLVEGNDGRLYGTTYLGGVHGNGTVFAVEADGSEFTVLRHLASSDGANPYAGLMKGSDGRLYGTTSSGGTNEHGTVFAVEENGSGFTVLWHLNGPTDGRSPRAGLVEGSDGRLYGTTFLGGTHGHGTVFAVAVTADGNEFTVLWELNGPIDGKNPQAGLVEGSDGRLYGTTSLGGDGYGTVFAVSKDGGAIAVLQNLDGSTDGANPFAGLVDGGDGLLYGATYSGGVLGNGTLFAVAADGSAFTVLRDLEDSLDGRNPYGGLVKGSLGNLYGTTNAGGTHGYGTVFAMATNGSGFTVLRHLSASSNGRNPYAGLVEGSDGRLYGTTVAGGSHGHGTVFAVEADGSEFTVLRQLDSSGDGASPYAGLVEGSDERLYGTTVSGGTHGHGTLFAVEADGSEFMVLRHLDASSDGANPFAGLMEGSDGRFYGTTSSGGANSYGTVFALAANGGGFMVLRELDYSGDGGYPRAGLVEDSDGQLYGTTVSGGAHVNGTVFAMTMNGDEFTVLWDLETSADGSGLVKGTDGRLYGTTVWGGTLGNGTVFAVTTDGSEFTVLWDLDASIDGANPYAPLVKGSDGRLFGTTISGGTHGSGTVFAVAADGSEFTVLRHLDASIDGANPYAGLVEGSDGRLYGTAFAGGTYGYGTLFAVAFVPPVITSELTASGSYGSSFSYQITATNSPTSFEAFGLPDFLSIDSFGEISGTPNKSGVFSVTIRAADADGADEQTLVLTIEKAVLTVTAEDKTRGYGESNPPLTYTITGFVLADTQATATTGAPEISTTATTADLPGDYPITALQDTLAADNYTFTFVAGALTIEVPDTPLELWRHAHFGSYDDAGDAANSADPDGDGDTNFEEFAFDSDPLDGANSGKFRASVEHVGDHDYLTLTLPVRDGADFSADPEPGPQTATIDGITYLIQATTNLLDFTEGDVEGLMYVLDSDLPDLSPGYAYRTFRMTAPIDGTASGFMRAVVDLPASP